MPSKVAAGPSFKRGLRSEALQTYRRKYDTILTSLAPVMRVGVPSDGDKETYFYWESAPDIERWVRGQPIPHKGFGGVNFEVSNHKWGLAIQWDRESEEDDQTKDLMNQAQDAASRAATLEERIFFQVLLGTTNSALLPSIPTAPDGAALFATTAGGSARFGATNGNLLTGTGVATAAAIRTDYWALRAQFKQYQDTQGEPLHDDSALDGSCTIIAAATNEGIMAEAFLREVIQGSSAGVSDEIRASGKTPRVMTTQRITGNDWYGFLDAIPTKAIFSQHRIPFEVHNQNPENSDQSREEDVRGIFMRRRLGVGVMTPYAAIHNNN